MLLCALQVALSAQQIGEVAVQRGLAVAVALHRAQP